MSLEIYFKDVIASFDGSSVQLKDRGIPKDQLCLETSYKGNEDAFAPLLELLKLPAPNLQSFVEFAFNHNCVTKGYGSYCLKAMGYKGKFNVAYTMEDPYGKTLDNPYISVS